MNGTGYKLLGFAVWRGAKWYARRKICSPPRNGRRAARALAGLGAVAALIARRATS